MGDAAWLIVVICILLVGNGLFSGAEIAVISARRSRIDALAAEGRRAARRLKDLQANMDGFLATVRSESPSGELPGPRRLPGHLREPSGKTVFRNGSHPTDIHHRVAAASSTSS